MALRCGLAPLSLLLVFSTSFAQQDAELELQGRGERRISKTDVAKKYHQPANLSGTPGAVRLAEFEKRKQLERSSPFGGILWQSIGPELQGGRVIDIAAPVNNPNAVHVAYATGGLWRTEDDGITWTALFDGQSAYAIGDFALSKDGKTIWVGTGENNSQRTSYSGTGVFKSTDSGKTWANMGLHDSHRIGRVLIDPRNEDTVYVAAVGALYSQNPERGVFKTTNGGKTWTWALKLNEYTGVIDLAMDPKNPEVLYASAWDRDRRTWNFREGGPGTAIYKSSNGGKTWSKLSKGLPKSDEIGRIGLAVAPSSPKTVYAFIDNQGPDPEPELVDERQPSGTLTLRRFQLLTEEMLLQVDKKVLEPFWNNNGPKDLKLDDALAQLKDKKLTLDQIKQKMLERNPGVFDADIVEAEVYRSDDYGATWRRTHRGLIGAHGGYYCGQVIVNPKDENDLVITGTILLRSKDGGKTWDEIASEVHVDHHAFWFDPSNPKHTFNGNDGGLYSSRDDSETWRHHNNLAVGQFTTIAVDTKTPYNVYGGLQDNGTLKGPRNYELRTQNNVFGGKWTTIGWGDGSAIAVDPRGDGDVVYTASQFGAHGAQDQKTGQRWSTVPRGQGLRFNWVSPFIVSSHHPDIVYVGSQKLHRSFNQGRAWTDLSDDLSKNLPNGNVPYSTMKDLSESPFQFGLIYCGFDDGTVKMTPDSGYTWVDIATPQPKKWVSRIVASKWDKATVYCSQSGYREDDFSAYLWKSTNYGKTWTSIVANLPAETINVVREDPNKRGVLYVGTDLGVYISMDDGGSWEMLQGGLPTTPVHDLVIHPREQELVIASHARSVWVLPLKTILSITPELRAADLTIFPISDAVITSRTPLRRRGAWDTKDPVSAKLTGSFYTKRAGKATVRIKSKDGKVVKEQALDALTGYNFLSVDLLVTPGKPNTVDLKARKVTSVEEALADPLAAERPVYLPAGEYKVEIQVGDVKKEVDWKISS
jgi:photosystem II stability/assembly factor-like uncharacterized protein